MSDTTIYNEAILEAKKLRAVAEANATKVIIESVTPRVREMIERQLLGEATEDDESDILDDVINDVAACDTKKVSSLAEVADTDEDDKSDEDLLLSTESAKIFARFETLQKRVSYIRELSESSKGTRLKKTFFRMVDKMITEAKTLESDMIRITGKELNEGSQNFSNDIKSILEEITAMASKKRINEEEEMVDVDLGDDASGEMGDMDIDLGDEGGDEAQEDVTLSADLAQELLTALESELGEEGEEGEAEMPDFDDSPEEDVVDEGEEMIEIDESMLRREIARMRGNSLDEAGKKMLGKMPKAPPAGKKGGAADTKVTSSFGGGKVLREPFVDSSDSDINVFAEVRMLKTALQKEGRKNRALRERLEEYRKATSNLQEQLEQLNLFNAKLLYVNKLVSNEGVTARQKKTIIEALDKAKTLREVKLLYKTLTESLSKVKSRGSVNESVHRSASSSRPTASASSSATSSESYQTDRWATLAGFGKDTK
jgi:hypothetical protein